MSAEMSAVSRCEWEDSSSLKVTWCKRMMVGCDEGPVLAVLAAPYDVGYEDEYEIVGEGEGEGERGERVIEEAK